MSRAVQRARIAGATSLLCVAVLWGAAPVAAEDDAQELAKKLSNPVASLISVPLQLNGRGIRFLLPGEKIREIRSAAASDMSAIGTPPAAPARRHHSRRSIDD